MHINSLGLGKPCFLNLNLQKSKLACRASFGGRINSVGFRVPVQQVGGCQNYGPFSDPYFNTAPNIQGTPKNIILTSTEVTATRPRAFFCKSPTSAVGAMYPSL